MTLLWKLILTAIVVVAAAVPLGWGTIGAQTLPLPPAFTYATVSIHRLSTNRGSPEIRPGVGHSLRLQNVTAMFMLTFAYGVREYQIVGAPSWVSSDRFDVMATPGKADAVIPDGVSMNEPEQRTQAILRDRFGLVLRSDVHQQLVYALTLAKGGHKLSRPTGPDYGPTMLGSGGQVTGNRATMKMLAEQLSRVLGRQVFDDTGLKGSFDFELKWTPDPIEPDGRARSIVAAIEEQLGLQLESRKGPVPVYVIEMIKEPSDR